MLTAARKADIPQPTSQNALVHSDLQKVVFYIFWDNAHYRDIEIL
jgi:hypothetical protein